MINVKLKSSLIFKSFMELYLSKLEQKGIDIIVL